MSVKHQDAEQPYKRFGQQVKNLRLKQGWSQTILAGLSGLSVPSIAQIERGEFNVRLSTLLALAQAFRNQLPELLRGIE